ncbi:MAG: methyltransferase domain-containing protein [Chloroflexi bacterium]|nr:methyltransferase domain-containing protein [Chloroflexota bacterium]
MTEWNARAYTRLSSPMQTWGEAVLDGLHLHGDETALDLGCGNGTLTQHLLERLPRGKVIAVDRSANMLAAAREHLEPRFAGHVEYLQRSLGELDFDEVADLAFSNAAFHWIKDHPRLFRVIFRAMKPGALLVAQCGGEPNIAIVRERAARLMQAEPYRHYFDGWTSPWEFATPELMSERLTAAGFSDVETSRFEAPVRLSSLEETRDYLTNVILGTHLERIAEPELRKQFVETLARQYAEDDPPYVFDYWRLNLRARRPAD